MSAGFNSPEDLKAHSLLFVGNNFGVDLQEHPAIWESLYDVFKSAREQGQDLGALIKDHLIEGQTIDDAVVMRLMQSAHSVLHELQGVIELEGIER